MLQDDVVELLTEVVPRMVEARMEGDQAEAGQKRPYEEAGSPGENAEEPPAPRPRTETVSVQVDSAVRSVVSSRGFRSHAAVARRSDM